MAKPSNLDKILKSQQKKLETILKNPGKITWRDRFSEFRENLKNPAYCSGIFFSFAGGLLASYAINNMFIPKTLKFACDYIDNLRDFLDIGNSLGIPTPMSSEMLDTPMELLANTRGSYSKVAQQLEDSLLNNQHLFQPGSPLKPAINFLDTYGNEFFKSGILKKIHHQMLYGITILIIGFGFYLQNNYELPNNITDKKYYRKQLKKILPEIRKNLQENPNAGSFYDIIFKLAENTQLLDEHLDFLDLTKALSNPRLCEDKPLLQEITQNASSYTTAYNIYKVIEDYL